MENRVFENQTLRVLNSPNTIIRSNTFTAIRGSSSLIIIEVINSTGTIVENNIIEDCRIEGTVMGLFIENSSGTKIVSNTIRDLGSTSDVSNTTTASGIFVLDSDDITIDNNTISTLEGSGISGITTAHSNQITVSKNRIENLISDGSIVHEITAIGIETSYQVTVASNSISDIISISTLQSTSFGISLYKSHFVSMGANRIVNINATSPDPNSFGLHVLNSTDIYTENNEIEQIVSSSSFTKESYATGIYVVYTLIFQSSNDRITNVKNLGRAAYGIFVDRSVAITFSGLLLKDTWSNSLSTTLSAGITVRLTTSFLLENSTVFNTLATISPDISDVIASAVGVILDNSYNSTLHFNSIEKVWTSGSVQAIDGLGLLVLNSDHSFLLSNRILDVEATGGNDAIASGFMMSDNTDLQLLDNFVKNVAATGDSYGMYFSGILKSTIANNSFVGITATDKAYGINVFSGYQNSIKGNTIQNLRSNTLTRGIRLSFSSAFQISDNIMTDKDPQDGSYGVYIANTKNVSLDNNRFSNKAIWLFIDEDSISIDCGLNIVDDELRETCIVTETKTFAPNTPSMSQFIMSETSSSSWPVYLVPIIFMISIKILRSHPTKK